MLDACSEAKLVVDPLGVLTGSPVAYEQSGTDAHITYEGSGGTTWTCLYETSSGSAFVDGSFE